MSDINENVNEPCWIAIPETAVELGKQIENEIMASNPDMSDNEKIAEQLTEKWVPHCHDVSDGGLSRAQIYNVILSAYSLMGLRGVTATMVLMFWIK